MPAPWAEDFAALPIGGFYRYRRGGETHAWEASLIHTLQSAVSSEAYQTFKRYSEAVAKLPPVTLRDLLDFRQGRTPISIDEVESITEIRKRFVTPGMSLGCAVARGPRHAQHRHEPHRRQVGLRRRRRGSRTLPPAAERRQCQLRHQADRLRALRRHGGISQPLPRDRDQGGPGRQAGRGRPAAGIQGDGDDRQAPACHARRHR